MIAWQNDRVRIGAYSIQESLKNAQKVSNGLEHMARPRRVENVTRDHQGGLIILVVLGVGMLASQGLDERVDNSRLTQPRWVDVQIGEMNEARHARVPYREHRGCCAPAL